MRIGLFLGIPGSPTELADAVVQAEEQGFAAAWAPQIFGPDALTVLALAGARTSTIELGTAVVPTYPRHPFVLAGQALTTQAVSAGRLTLGIGLSHRIVIEDMFGYSYERPLEHMREYLAALLPLLRGEAAAYQGRTLKAAGQVTVPGAEPVPVLLAALGPGMLRLAGEQTAGTVTWMVGVETLGSHIVPSITAAAEGAGRPPARVVMGLPVCVTGDVEGARERAGRIFAVYGGLPSYRAMLDREGAEGPADVAVAGDEDAVAARLSAAAAAGATDFCASVFGSAEERERTTAVLAELAKTGVSG